MGGISARYGLAALCAGVGFVLGWLLQDTLAQMGPLYAGVVLAALLGGTGPGLMATLLTAGLIATGLVMHANPAQLAWLAVTGVMASLLAGRLVSSDRAANRTASDVQEQLTIARMSELRLRLLVEGLTDYAVLAIDPKGQIIDANSAAERVTGFAKSELRGQPFEALFTPEDRAAGVPEEELLAACSRGSVLQERWYVRRDGSRYWGVGVLTALRDESGALLGYVKLRRDLTPQKLAEESIRRSENRLRMTTDAVPALIAFIDTKQQYCLANRQHEEWLRQKRERMLGRSVREVLGEEIYAVVQPHLQIALAGRQVSHEAALRFPDGKVRNVAATYIPERTVDGQVRGLVWFLADMTAMKAAEAERSRLLDQDRRSSASLEAIQQIDKMLSAGLDLEKLLQAVTNTARELIGAEIGAGLCNLPDATTHPMPLLAVSGVGPELAARITSEGLPSLFSQAVLGEKAVRVEDLSRDLQWVGAICTTPLPPEAPVIRSYLAVPLLARAGHLIGGLFFGHSSAGVFTEREERIVRSLSAQAAIAIENVQLFEQLRRERNAAEAARQAAEDANRSKDQFLAIVSHELRTPLTAILGWAKLLHDNQGSDPELAREAIETIDRSAQSQAQLIDDLLDMSRIASGKLKMEFSPAELGPIVGATLETMRPAAEAKGLNLEQHLAPEAMHVNADASRLQQVVWNLLSNAIKFTPAGGTVRALLRSAGDHAEIRISDTGLGIAPEFLPWVFERFRQADGSTTRRHGGLGLGLSIVKHIVELHGGTVHANSDGPGHGSTFSVRLPLVREAAGAEAPARELAAAGRPDLHGLHVLVVDDEKDARTIIQRVLEQCHARVTIATNAAIAMEVIKVSTPDVVISDIGMPEVDGYALIRMIRALPPEQGGSVPAVAVTAFARDEDRDRALAAGFQHHVAKPIDMPALTRLLAQLDESRGSPAGRHTGDAQERAAGLSV